MLHDCDPLTSWDHLILQQFWNFLVFFLLLNPMKLTRQLKDTLNPNFTLFFSTDSNKLITMMGIVTRLTFCVRSFLCIYLLMC